jgi:hypothetical protein
MTAEIIHLEVLPGPYPYNSPIIWAEVDCDQKQVMRRFKIVETGQEISKHSGHIGTYLAGSFLWHIRELFGRPLPAGLDLPDEAADAYRELTTAGFQIKVIPDCRNPDAKPLQAWVAPDDEPLTTELIMAVATLQEHGFGSVVSK